MSCIRTFLVSLFLVFSTTLLAAKQPLRQAPVDASRGYGEAQQDQPIRQDFGELSRTAQDQSQYSVHHVG